MWSSTSLELFERQRSAVSSREIQSKIYASRYPPLGNIFLYIYTYKWLLVSDAALDLRGTSCPLPLLPDLIDYRAAVTHVPGPLSQPTQIMLSTLAPHAASRKSARSA